MNSSLRKKKHLASVAASAFLIFAFVLVLGLGLKMDPNQAESALIGMKALPFSGTVISGNEYLPKKETVALADFLGKPLILNFWASWCVSCRSEAREMQNFWQAHKGSAQLLGIAIQDTREDALLFAKTYGKTYPLALDSDGLSNINYGVVGVPETFIIDSQGIIRFKFAGPVSEKILAEKLSLLLPAN